MTAAGIACGVLGPALFWVGYLYYKDRLAPEPLWAVGLAYLLGIASALVAIVGYELSPVLGLPDDPFALAQTNRLGFLAYAVGFVGVFEELCKMLPFVLVIVRLCPFDEVIDGIIYASAIALGYASLENLLYLSELEGASAYARAFAAPLVHTMFSSIWGLAIARARVARRPIGSAALVGLLVAALVHGMYDFVALHPVLQPASAAAIGAVWFWRMAVVKRLHEAHRRGQGSIEREDCDEPGGGR